MDAYTKLKYPGRSLSEVLTDRSVITPRYMPFPPMPARTRPIIRAFIFGAAPQRADPMLKSADDRMYSHFASNRP